MSIVMTCVHSLAYTFRPFFLPPFLPPSFLNTILLSFLPSLIHLFIQTFIHSFISPLHPLLPSGLVKQCSAPALSSNSGPNSGSSQKPLPSLHSHPEDDENVEKPAGESTSGFGQINDCACCLLVGVSCTTKGLQATKVLKMRRRQNHLHPDEVHSLSKLQGHMW